MQANPLSLFADIGVLLVLASLVGLVLKWRSRDAVNPLIDNLNARTMPGG